MRIVIADDSVLLREARCALLKDAGFEVVGQAGDGEDLLRKVRAHKPDVAIVDIRMPPNQSRRGAAGGQDHSRELPGTGVLVLSQYVEERYAVQLLDDGARGRRIPAQGPHRRDRSLHRRGAARGRGRLGLGPRGRAHMLGRRERDEPMQDLTPREREVLSLMAEGRTNPRSPARCRCPSAPWSAT